MQLSGPDDLEADDGLGGDRYRAIAKIVESGLLTDPEVAFVNTIRDLYHRASVETAAKGRCQPQPGSLVFHAGHVELGDDGAFYGRWKAAVEAKELRGGPRRSSHVSDAQQYEVALGPLGSVLFGTRDGGTWFQNERGAVTQGYWGKVKHVFHYLLHKASGNRQIGALGWSDHTEKNGAQLALRCDR